MMLVVMTLVMGTMSLAQVGRDSGLVMILSGFPVVIQSPHSGYSILKAWPLVATVQRYSQTIQRAQGNLKDLELLSLERS